MIAAALKHLLAAGVTGDGLVAAVADIEAALAAVPAVDEQAERRRAADRERARIRRQSAESADGLPKPQTESASSPEQNVPTPLKTQTPSPKENPPKGGQKKGCDEATPRAELEAVLDAEHAGAVIDHRQRLRKPLTARAAQLLAVEFGRAPDPNAAADTMIASGWQGFDVTWLQNRQRGQAPPGNRPRSMSARLVDLTQQPVEQTLADYHQRTRPEEPPPPALRAIR